MERRTFLTRITGFILGLIGLALSIPLVGYVVSPAFRRQAQDWAEAGGVHELSVGDPKELSYLVTLQDGWMKTTAVKSVWAVRQPDESVTVFSPLCTHLGCGYHWDSDDREFKCPCHNSIFDITGRVLSGPAPRPLDRLPFKVEKERLFVIYKQFKSGTSKQIEL
ncbi:MAG: ubiquinol-cytochrome c reductase iron-sulfur subunit [Nitrospirae bacterium]|nr:ubiquinol-cytochrome c reductase iron-sulfur subunit [Nitrospirota bacterium]